MDSTLIAALLTAGAAILVSIIASIVAIKQGVWVTKKQHEYDLQLLQQRMSDRDIFFAWRIAFDRGAFRGPWRWPQSYVDMFEKAIGEVLSAVNTGTIRNPDEKGKGKAYLTNPEWFSKMEEVTARLDRIIRFVREFKEHQQEIYTHETEFYTSWPLKKRSSQEFEKALQEHQQAQKEREKPLKEISEAVDHERDEIIEILNKIWEELNIYTMTRPTEEKTYDRDPIAV